MKNPSFGAKIDSRAPVFPRLLSTSALALVLAVSLAPSAMADGGRGGAYGQFSGGAGGTGYNGTAGSATTAICCGGGGGGGAGGGSGASGGENGGVSGGTGGAGGTFGSPNGQAGGSVASGGGGGGGGYNGGNYFGFGNGIVVTGGNGGDGGNTGGSGGGGGGGAGGYGVVVTGATSNSNSGTISGGNGGNGGNGGGSGGDGGVGILFTTSGATFTNTGTVTGGNGGQAGTGAGSAGAGGIGIIGVGLAITNTGGTITGGKANAGAGAQNYAIQFTGGTNSVGTGGTITGGINVTGGGSFMPAAPGSTVGTPLAITGPLIFGAGTIYNVRVTPTASDSAAVTGSATVTNGASVAVTAGSGTYQASTKYTILTATGGVTGTFTGVTSNLAFLTPSLSYDANDVYLTLTYSSSTSSGSPNYRTAAGNGNQYAVASALTNAGTSNPNAPILNALNQLTVAQAQAAFNALSGEGIAAAKTAGFQMTGLFSGAMSDQSTLWLDGGHTGNEMVMTEQPTGVLGYAPSTKMKTPIVVHDPVLPPVRTWRAWASGFGGDETLHGDAGTGSAAQSSSYYGGAMGVDYQINPDLLFGIAGSGSNGSFSVSGRSTYGSVTGGGIGAYGVATFGSYYAASSTSLGFFHNSETRSLSGFGGLGFETDHGSFDSIAVRTRLEAGRRFTDVFGAAVTPFVALEIANLHSNGFNEAPTQGAGVFALNTQGSDTVSAPIYFGVRLERLYGLTNGMSLRPILSLAYGHDFAVQSQITNTLLGLSGNPFGITGARIARDFAQTKAGFELAFAPNAVAFVNFDGNFSSRDQLYGGKGGVKLTW